MKFKINLFVSLLILIGIIKYYLEFISEGVGSIIMVVIDVTIMYLAFSVMDKKSRHAKSLIAFLIISSLTFFISHSNSLTSHVNGIRELLSLFFIFIFFERVFRSEYIYYLNSLITIFAKLFLVIQIPVSFIQYLIFGPGDGVTGTLGPGCSGVLTFSIFLLIYYLIENNNSKNKVMNNLYYIIFLIPVTLNETKITFILILLYFLSFFDLKKFKSSLLSIIIGLIVLISFSTLYKSQEKETDTSNPISNIFSEDFLTMYLIGDNRDSEYEDIPRIAKIIVGTDLLIKNNNLILGQEYGAFKGGQKLKTSKFAEMYDWLLRGSRPYLFYLLITGGISLFILVTYTFFKEIKYKPGKDFKNNSPNFLFFLGSIFILMLFYNDALRNHFFIMIFLYLLFYSKFFIKKSVLTNT